MQTPAIILAAGASRRLGRPKQLVQIEGETLLARTIRVVRASGAGPVVTVLGANHEIIRGAVDFNGVYPVTNTNWEQGIATSIQSGISEILRLVPDAGAVMILACDQPRLEAGHLRSLVAAQEQTVEPAIIASQYSGVAGIPAIFPASQFSNLMALRGDVGAKQIIRNPTCPMITIHLAEGEFDVDTPADLARLESTTLQK
jgi:molybdenum cofactor cytidylyltransferase